MTYKAVLEASKKPALGEFGKEKIDKSLAGIIKKGKEKGIGKDGWGELELLNSLYSINPDWSEQDRADIKKALDTATKVDSEQVDSQEQDQGNGLSPDKQDALNRMKKMMKNMNLKQIKILKAELSKGVKQ